MIKRDRNKVLALIEQSGFAASQFVASEQKTDRHVSFNVALRGHEFRFRFRSPQDEPYLFDVDFDRFPNGHSGPLPSAGWSDFDYATSHFVGWLNEHVKEFLVDVQTPDLWAELQRDRTELGQGPLADNTPFSEGERSRIATSLKEFTLSVEQRRMLSEAQLTTLRERVEYLIEASSRMGRKDWMAAAAGVLIGFALEASLASSVAHELLQLAGSALQWIAHAPLQLPGL